MASLTDIANRALSLLGQAAIVSLNDKTPESEEIRRVLPFVLDSVYRMYPWNCLSKRVVLAPLTTPPVSTYSYAYRLPSDCLRVLEVEMDSHTKYRVEGRDLLCNAADEVRLRYVQYTEDPNLLDGLLREVIAYYIAVSLCERITQSNNKADLMRRGFNEVLRYAVRADSQENPPVRFAESSWLRARYWN